MTLKQSRKINLLLNVIVGILMSKLISRVLFVKVDTCGALEFNAVC